MRRARRLLGRRSAAARRDELAEALQQLTDTVTVALAMLADDSGAPTNDAPSQGEADSRGHDA